MVQIDKLDLVLEENSNLDESTNQARYCMLSANFFFFLDNSIITIGGRGGGVFEPPKGDQPMHEALGKYCVVNYLLSCLALVLWYE